ncbi:hypothetical protein Pfo_013916, partial [Paulownia fortunei]
MEHFSAIRSCWGGATVSQVAESAFSGRQTTEGERLMKVKSTGKTTHWKPNLQAISEDRPTSEVDSGGVNRRTTETDNKKRPVKVKAESTAKVVRPPPSPGKDYWYEIFPHDSPACDHSNPVFVL